MSRWFCFLFCAVLGLAMFAGGLLVPAHLRAVDARVLKTAGRGTAGLADRGLELAESKRPGPALMLLRAAQEEGIPDQTGWGAAITNLAEAHPEWMALGQSDPAMEKLFGNAAAGNSEPFTEFVVRRENREKALEYLRQSPRAEAQVLLLYRSFTNTVIFSPSESASGQALDAAVVIAGLLLAQGHLTKDLSNAILELAADANRGENAQRFEQLLFDLMSLGRRFNRGQLVAFLERVEDPETLRHLAGIIREDERRAPVLFAAVQLSGRPDDVAEYVMNFSETGITDLGASLRFGAGGVNELLQRDKQLNSSRMLHGLATNPVARAFSDAATGFALRMPRVAMAGKWLLYLAGGFLLAAALHFARPKVPRLERPLQVRGFHLAREFLFALGFLVVVLLFSEPYLTQSSQKVEMPFRLRLPTVDGIVSAETINIHHSIMNQLSLLTLLLFFVIQSLIYMACLVKLAEVRRQKIQPRIKLKLLDNEDHLFDAGLYVGFVGTIISLILVSLGIVKPSLMAAYSSTSFGIIFVCIFKIFHLRPLRRKLLLEAESASQRIVLTPSPSPASS